ncbi:MAG TPA: hypothetical protein VLX58_20370 [Bryobacteraceae bacterium]|nr:hypothetical protein [Bryobacteraceae bacterium]
MTRLTVLLCFCLAARAQSPASESQTIQTLLAEVHQLRLALERSSQIAPRIQIAVERIKLQQEQVSRTARQLDDLRRDLEKGHSEQARVQQRMQAADNQANQSTDPNQRRDLDDLMKMLKMEAEQGEKSLQQMQAREGELAGQFQTDQSRLNELNDRLDQLERELSIR